MNNRNDKISDGENKVLWSKIPSHSSLLPGQIVRSIAGRDKGAYYLIYAVEGEYLLLVDGVKRGVISPKKKNRRHVQPSNKVAADFIAKRDHGVPVRNEDIRSIINGIPEDLGLE